MRKTLNKEPQMHNTTPVLFGPLGQVILPLSTAAALLSITPDALRRAISRHRIPAFQMPPSPNWWLYRDDIIAYSNTRRRKPK